MLSEIHLTEHGYGVLAQELYMKLAFSPKIKERVDKISLSNALPKPVAADNKVKQAIMQSPLTN